MNQERQSPRITDVLSPIDIAIVGASRSGLVINEIAAKLNQNPGAIQARWRRAGIRTGFTAQELALWYDAEFETSEYNLREAHHAMEKLSDYEKQIMRLLGVGFPDHRIAEALKISPETVRAYHRRITTWLGIRDLDAYSHTGHLATALGVFASRAMRYETGDQSPMLSLSAQLPTEEADEGGINLSFIPTLEPTKAIALLRDGLGPEDIATLFDLSVSAVYRHLKKAKKVTGLDLTNLVLQFDSELPSSAAMSREAYVAFRALSPQERESVFLMGKGATKRQIKALGYADITEQAYQIAQSMRIQGNEWLKLALIASRAERWAAENDLPFMDQPQSNAISDSEEDRTAAEAQDVANSVAEETTPEIRPTKSRDGGIIFENNPELILRDLLSIIDNKLLETLKVRKVVWGALRLGSILSPEELGVVARLRDGNEYGDFASMRDTFPKKPREYVYEMHKRTGLNRINLVLQYDRERPLPRTMLKAYRDMRCLNPHLQEVMLLLGLGLSVREIASTLFMGESVVKRRVTQIVDELDVERNLTDLALTASRAMLWAEQASQEKKKGLLDLVIEGQSFKEISDYFALDENTLSRVLDEVSRITERPLLINCHDRDTGMLDVYQQQEAFNVWAKLSDLEKERAVVFARGLRREHASQLGTTLADLKMHRQIIVEKFKVKNSIALAIRLLRVQNYLHRQITQQPITESRIGGRSAVELELISENISNPAQFEDALLQKIWQGLTDKEIAANTGLSFMAVRRSIERLLRQYGVSNRQELAVCFDNSQILSSDTLLKDLETFHSLTTDRQRQIVILSTSGLSADEVSVSLGISKSRIEKVLNQVHKQIFGEVRPMNLALIGARAIRGMQVVGP